jgi:hypothetical protein
MTTNIKGANSTVGADGGILSGFFKIAKGSRVVYVDVGGVGGTGGGGGGASGISEALAISGGRAPSGTGGAVEIYKVAV